MPDISKTDILMITDCLDALIKLMNDSCNRESTRTVNRIRIIKKLNNKLLNKISNNDNKTRHRRTSR